MSVEAELAALQARVAALEAQQVGGDTITPTYLTIDAQGHVTANFTGHIKASGVDLPEAANTLIFSGANAVDWLDQVTQQVREYITGGLQGSLHALFLQSGPGANGEKASMTLFHTDTGSAAASVTANDGAGHNVTARIIDPLGGSNFLQLAGASPRQLAIDAGSGNTGAGASVVVAHGLGRIPICALAVPVANVVGVAAISAASITVNASAAGTGFYWAVIG